MFTSLPVIMLLFSAPSLAYPTGAGNCAAGLKAINGNGSPPSHVTNANVVTGTLAEGNIELELNGQALSTDTPAPFEIGSPQTLVLSTTDGSTFAGFLMRIESESGVRTVEALTAVTDDALVQVSTSQCQVQAGVGGVTHTSRDRKETVNAMLFMEEVAEDLVLDVTVVVANNNTISIYYFSSFTLQAVLPEGTPAPSAAPPMASPVIPPVDSPMAEPVMPPMEPASSTSSHIRMGMQLLLSCVVLVAFF